MDTIVYFISHLKLTYSVTRMALSSQYFKNFLTGNTLKDYLDLYQPLPPLAKKHLFPSNSLKVQNLFKEKCGVARVCSNEHHVDFQLGICDALFDVTLHSKMYSEYCRCISSCASIFAPYKIRKASIYVVLFDMEEKCKRNALYYQVKFYIIRQIIYEMYNELCTVAFVNVSSKNGSELHMQEISCWRERQVAPFVEECFTYFQLLCNESQTWSLQGPKPSNHLLYPNLGLKETDQYSQYKEELAWRYKELSLLYFIGPVTRAALHEKGVYSLDHPDLHSYIFSGPNCIARTNLEIQAIQKIMLTTMFRELVVCEAPNPSQKLDEYVYLDIETSYKDDKSICNLVGLWYKDESTDWTYKYFLSRDESCLLTAKTWIEEHIRDRTLVHYTSADSAAIPRSIKSLDLFDVVSKTYVTSSQLQSLNLHNFKLKTIYKQICKRWKTQNLYDNGTVKNGLDALHILNDYSKGLPNDDDVQDVIAYNKVDVIALWTLHKYIESA